MKFQTTKMVSITLEEEESNLLVHLLQDHISNSKGELNKEELEVRKQLILNLGTYDEGVFMIRIGDKEKPLRLINDPIGCYSYLPDGHKVRIIEEDDDCYIGRCCHGDQFKISKNSELYEQVGINKVESNPESGHSYLVVHQFIGKKELLVNSYKEYKDAVLFCLEHLNKMKFVIIRGIEITESKLSQL